MKKVDCIDFSSQKLQNKLGISIKKVNFGACVFRRFICLNIFMKQQFYNRSFKVIIREVLVFLFVSLLITVCIVGSIIDIIKGIKNGNAVDTIIVSSALILCVILCIKLLQIISKVLYIYTFDSNYMKISVLSMILKTIAYEDVKKIEINNSEQNEVCNIYYQNKHITIDRKSLHYLDMKMLLLQYCKNAEVIESYQ
jgi:hypothetical protein